MKSDVQHRLLWKVLKANISISQISGYALALFAGLTVVALAAALYSDGMRVARANGSDNIFPAGFVVLSKQNPQSPFGLLGERPGFTESDINTIAGQPWVKRCSPFESSRFDASVTADFGAARFSTAIFFEAVPDEFFDAIPDGWDFNPSEPEVPIILPADYLAMYNLGFAPARGLPKLSDKLIMRIPVNVYISGPKGMVTLRGRIAGFSRRLNTIAVPLGFLRWANQTYGSDTATLPTRLIAETAGGKEADAETYFKRAGIDVSGISGETSRLTTIVRGITGVAGIAGCALCLLAFFIMTLSLRLLVQKNKEAIRDLRRLGFSTGDIAKSYRHLVIWVNAAAMAGALATLFVAAPLWHPTILALGATPASLFPAAMSTFIVTLLLTGASYISLGELVRRAGTAA